MAICSTIRHVPAHTIWAHIFEGHEMDVEDQDHIVACGLCIQVFNLCLKSDSFGAALKSLPPGESDQRY
jgi:hypothetical protein